MVATSVFLAGQPAAVDEHITNYSHKERLIPLSLSVD